MPHEGQCPEEHAGLLVRAKLRLAVQPLIRLASNLAMRHQTHGETANTMPVEDLCSCHRPDRIRGIGRIGCAPAIIRAPGPPLTRSPGIPGSHGDRHGRCRSQCAPGRARLARGRPAVVPLKEPRSLAPCSDQSTRAEAGPLRRQGEAGAAHLLHGCGQPSRHLGLQTCASSGETVSRCPVLRS